MKFPFFKCASLYHPDVVKKISTDVRETNRASPCESRAEISAFLDTSQRESQIEEMYCLSSNLFSKSTLFILLPESLPVVCSLLFFYEFMCQKRRVRRCRQSQLAGIRFPKSSTLKDIVGWGVPLAQPPKVRPKFLPGLLSPFKLLSRHGNNRAAAFNLIEQG